MTHGSATDTAKRPLPVLHGERGSRSFNAETDAHLGQSNA